MKKIILLIVIAMFLLADTDAHPILKSPQVTDIENNKEAFSRQLSKKDFEKIKKWESKFSAAGELKKISRDILQKTLKTWEEENYQSEEDFLLSLKKFSIEKNLMKTEGDFYGLIAFMRQNDLMDDILFKIIKGAIHKNQFSSLRLESYFQTLKEVKDKMTTSPEKKTTKLFSIKYASRRQKLTRREELYQKYNSTQIFILAQIVEKTSKRINSHQSWLTWDYSDSSEEEEVYIFSPMEQYRASIKMLRRDLGEIMRSSAFQFNNVSYEHLITAAFETGFIKSEEIDYIVQFEEYWNPKTPPWKSYLEMALSLTGSATVYLPPPWNTIGALGLILGQNQLLKNQKKKNGEDNWSVIL